LIALWIGRDGRQTFFFFFFLLFKRMAATELKLSSATAKSPAVDASNELMGIKFLRVPEAVRSSAGDLKETLSDLEWHCQSCTMINKITTNSCQICFTYMPFTSEPAVYEIKYQEVSAAAAEVKLVMFFGAYWCKLSRQICNDLLQWYESDPLVKEGKVEVVYVSSDCNREQYNAMVRKMPWLLIPYVSNTSSVRTKLYHHFNIENVPTVGLLTNTKDSRLVTDGVLGEIRDGRPYPWTPISIPERLGTKLLSHAEVPTKEAKYFAVLLAKSSPETKSIIEFIETLKGKVASFQGLLHVPLESPDAKYEYFRRCNPDSRTILIVVDAYTGKIVADNAISACLNNLFDFPWTSKPTSTLCKSETKKVRDHHSTMIDELSILNVGYLGMNSILLYVYDVDDASTKIAQDKLHNAMNPKIYCLTANIRASKLLLDHISHVIGCPPFKVGGIYLWTDSDAAGFRISKVLPSPFVPDRVIWNESLSGGMEFRDLMEHFTQACNISGFINRYSSSNVGIGS
jgi:hypothetical protein